MHFSFLHVNENADENEIPFFAEKRKRKSPVPISQNLVILRFSCEHNIFSPTQMAFLASKNKTKMKIHFRPKPNQKWPNNPFSTPKTNFGRLPVWWLDSTDPDRLNPQTLRQIYAAGRLKGFPLELGIGAWSQKTRIMGLPGQERCLTILTENKTLLYNQVILQQYIA